MTKLKKWVTSKFIETLIILPWHFNFKNGFTVIQNLNLRIKKKNSKKKKWPINYLINYYWPTGKNKNEFEFLE